MNGQINELYKIRNIGTQLTRRMRILVPYMTIVSHVRLKYLLTLYTEQDIFDNFYFFDISFDCTNFVIALVSVRVSVRQHIRVFHIPYL